MMNAAIVAASLLGQSPEPTKFDYNVIMGGKSAGSATMTIKDVGHTRIVGTTVEVKISGQSATVRTSTTYGADGAAISTVLFVQATTGTQAVNVNFDAKGANVVSSLNDKESRSFVAVSSAAPRSNPAQYWFSRTRPKVREKISYYAFDINSLTWRLMTSEYLESKPYKIGEKTYDAHHVLITRGGDLINYWLDDAGNPVSIIQPNGDKLERK
ncbi:MAG: hypothetical protein JNK63_01650 [Chthonomonas sp.]|nr:hypothetical protein [Chthonomonas sp.]